jgi:hypothetical protein
MGGASTLTAKGLLKNTTPGTATCGPNVRDGVAGSAADAADTPNNPATTDAKTMAKGR